MVAWCGTGAKRVNSPDLDLDTQLMSLESQWRQVYEDSIDARAEYQSAVASGADDTGYIKLARARLDETETMKGKIMARIKHIEAAAFGSG